MKLYDLINPVKIMAFFTLYGGGSGGGSGGSSQPDTRYANLDALYGTQNQASQFMLNNAMPHVPQITQNSASMVNDAMDGTLARQMRDQAGNNAQMSYGSALDSNNRNMQRYGMGFNANRLMSENNRNAIMGAGMKSGEMNRANAAAEDMKWNRNANFYGQVMGMNNGAMQSMSSAGSGMANSANAQSQADQKNAAGFGQAGASFGSALFKADGGYIEQPARLANGGNAWEAYKAANPVQATGSSTNGKKTNPYLGMLSGAAPAIAGAGLKDLFQGDKSKILKAGGQALNYARGLNTGTAPMNETPVSDVGGLMTYADGTQAMTGADIAADGFSGLSAGADAGSYYDAGNVAVNGWGGAEGGIAGLDTAVQATSEASTAADIATALPWGFKDGGAIRKRGLKLALGGMANASVNRSSTVDNQSMANMDASQSYAPARMDDMALAKSSKLANSQTHAVAAPIVTEQKDPTEQAVKSTLANQAAKAATTSLLEGAAGSAAGTGAGLAAGTGAGVTAGAAGTGAGLAAGTGAGLTVGAGGGVAAGTGAGLAAGAAGTGAGLAAGTGAGLTAGAAGAAAGVGGGAAAGAAAGSVVPVVGTAVGALAGMLASRYLANGGRVDHTAGGKVQGPGTETSDDIPAWLSDGEYVLNAEAVKLIGKAKLEKLNKRGLKLRGQNEEAAEGTPGVEDSPAEEAKEMKRGLKMKAPKQFRPKKAVKLAEGGDPVEEMLRKNAEKYGVKNSSTPVETPPPAPVAPPPAPKKEQTLSERLRNFATGGLDKRMKDAGAYAKGGLVMKRKGC